jgi:hypothetical protein
MNLTVVRDDVYVNYENGNLHLYYSIEQTSISMHILGIRTHEFDLKKRLVKKFPASHLTWTGLVKKTSVYSCIEFAARAISHFCIIELFSKLIKKRGRDENGAKKRI